MDERIQEWRKSGKYLPRFMRDFHDQKDTFRTLHSRVNVEGHEYAKDIGWIAGQCYVIDIFLWHMARHGWVLRRASQKFDFEDIEEANRKAMDEWRDASLRAMGITPLNHQLTRLSTE